MSLSILVSPLHVYVSSLSEPKKNIYTLSTQIVKKMNMFCFDHFAAWMFLVDMLSDGLATTKYKEKCDVGELPCYFWWLSMTFMLLPTLGFVFTVLMLARKQTRDIFQLIAYTFLAILYPILGASGIFVTCFNHFFCGENNKGQNLMMLPQFLFECIPQVRVLYF